MGHAPTVAWLAVARGLFAIGKSSETCFHIEGLSVYQVVQQQLQC